MKLCSLTFMSNFIDTPLHDASACYNTYLILPTCGNKDKYRDKKTPRRVHGCSLQNLGILTFSTPCPQLFPHWLETNCSYPLYFRLDASIDSAYNQFTFLEKVRILNLEAVPHFSVHIPGSLESTNSLTLTA